MKTKIIVAWLCLVAFALALAGSCSIKHPSEQYECDTNADCVELGDNRVCSGGLCVVPGGTMSDAATDGGRVDALPDASLMCPSQCTQCNTEKKECVIDCNAQPTKCDSNAGQVVCPAGWNCNIKCNTGSSCRNGVNCLNSQSCNVECTGNFSCRNVACGPGPCQVNCAGNQSCSGVSCGQSCACDVKCTPGVSSCFNVICKSAFCDIGLGCSSEPNGCDTCP
jgi:hypothetical protein